MSKRLILRASIEDDENWRNSINVQRVASWDSDVKLSVFDLPTEMFKDMIAQLRRAIGEDE